jgi:hypothetical protein
MIRGAIIPGPLKYQYFFIHIDNGSGCMGSDSDFLKEKAGVALAMSVYGGWRLVAASILQN